MRLPDGREAIARLELPLPVTMLARVLGAMSDELEALGYTDAALLADGTSRIVATPPEGAPA